MYSTDHKLFNPRSRSTRVGEASAHKMVASVREQSTSTHECKYAHALTPVCTHAHVGRAGRSLPHEPKIKTPMYKIKRMMGRLNVLPLAHVRGVQ